MGVQSGNREIHHGIKLAKGDPELIWGWATPAGRLRAMRRGKMIASGAGLGSGTRVLEIGCGTGVFTRMFAQTGAQLLAVDISADLIKMAKSKKPTSPRVRFLQKRFEDCDVHGPFDAVIGSSVLHHLDLSLALNKIYDLLKPGGIMGFTEPNMLNPQIFLQKNVAWLKRRLGDSPDETAFFHWRLRGLLLQTGFEQVEIEPFDWLHPATPPALIATVKQMAEVLERMPVLRQFAGSLWIRSRRPDKTMKQ
jgi:SAM-dependent methyltransferase